MLLPTFRPQYPDRCSSSSGKTRTPRAPVRERRRARRDSCAWQDAARTLQARLRWAPAGPDPTHEEVPAAQRVWAPVRDPRRRCRNRSHLRAPGAVLATTSLFVAPPLAASLRRRYRPRRPPACLMAKEAPEALVGVHAAGFRCSTQPWTLSVPAGFDQGTNTARVLRVDRTLRAGRIARPGARRDHANRANSRRSSRRSTQARAPGSCRCRPVRRQNPCSAAVAAGRGRPGAAHRVRERRQPAAGSRDLAPAGDRRAPALGASRGRIVGHCWPKAG